jgi:hypothetical protein
MTDAPIIRSEELTSLFSDLNRHLFNGKLPAYEVFLEEDNTADNLGWCSQPERRIYLWRPAVLTRAGDERNPLPPWRIREVLLHEMCHIGPPYGYGSWTNHGRAFQRRMVRLYIAGEEWVEDHLEGGMPGGETFLEDKLPNWPDLGDDFYPWRTRNYGLPCLGTGQGSSGVRRPRY